MTEDLDPIEDAISWLKFVVDNGRISEHDVNWVRDSVIPKALSLHAEQKAQISCISFEKEKSL